MTSDIDYSQVIIPEGKSREDYSYAERRAEILQIIKNLGHPGAVNKSKLAREYDVARDTIYNDFEKLAEYITDGLNNDHVFIMDAVFRKAVLEAVQEDDFEKAARLGKGWYDWLVDMGALERAPQRSEVDLDADIRQLVGKADVEFKVVRPWEDDDQDLARDVGFSATPDSGGSGVEIEWADEDGDEDGDEDDHSTGDEE